jgi:hypothetical protein
MKTPPLSEFRIEFPGNGLAHIVFDAPGRSMNVFSEAAILDIGRIAGWLEQADVKGALIRSGKPSGFCAGADLPEIWAAYETISATPKPRRFRAAYDHFFRLSLALRALETCGKPVACAIAGLALGGGGCRASPASKRRCRRCWTASVSPAKPRSRRASRRRWSSPARKSPPPRLGCSRRLRPCNRGTATTGSRRRRLR